MASKSSTFCTSQHDQRQPSSNAYRRKAPTATLIIPGTTSSTSIPPISSSSSSTIASSIMTQQEDKAMTRECLLFPTYAYRNPQNPSEWVIRTRGWALSHNRSQAKQKFVTSLTKGVVGQNSGDHATFEERFKYFLAKNKRNKHFTIQAVGTHPLPFEVWNSLSSSPTSSSSSSSPALPATPTDNIRMTMDQQRRDSDGSTDSGFQSSGMVGKADRYDQFYHHPLHHRSSNTESDEDEMIPAAVLDMERPANPLSSILSGQRVRSTTSLSSSLSSTNSNDSKQYHGDNDDDDDDDDDDTDDIDKNDENNMVIDNKTKRDHYLTNNTTHSDKSITTTATTLSSLFAYPSLISNTTSSHSTSISSPLNNCTDCKMDGQAIFKSESSGFFSGPTYLSHQQVLQWAKERDCCDARLLELRSSPCYDRQHPSRPMDIGLFPESSGMVNLVEPTGISIISDIDDTIKETQILHGARTVLNNTFFNTSKGISGMAEAYMKWYTQGASFHYVSNSPFQLLPFLHNFLNTTRFPPGSMHLRLDGSLMARLVEIPGRAKRDAILSIMRDFPQRQFILVGDSGEIDLEIYTKIAMENPRQILKVFIHDVTTPYAERKKRNKKSVPTSPSTDIISSTTMTKPGSNGTLSSSAANLTLPGELVRNSSMSFSSFFQQSHSTTSSESIITSPSQPSATTTVVLPLSSTTSSASLLDSDQHSRNSITPATHRHHKQKTNSLLDLASSFTSSSVLGIGRGRTKTLAELIIEPSTSSTTSTANTIGPDTSIPPSQQCVQLYDRIRKAQDQLPRNIEVVLFRNADALRDDTVIQDVLWQHWDNQCISAST